MRRLILLAGLALAALPAIPQRAEAHGPRDHHHRHWDRHEGRRHGEWRREEAWRRQEWRRERAWREREARRDAYRAGPPVAYAQPGLTVTIPLR